MDRRQLSEEVGRRFAAVTRLMEENQVPAASLVWCFPGDSMDRLTVETAGGCVDRGIQLKTLAIALAGGLKRDPSLSDDVIEDILAPVLAAISGGAEAEDEAVPEGDADVSANTGPTDSEPTEACAEVAAIAADPALGALREAADQLLGKIRSTGSATALIVWKHPSSTKSTTKCASLGFGHQRDILETLTSLLVGLTVNLSQDLRDLLLKRITEGLTVDQTNGNLAVHGLDKR